MSELTPVTREEMYLDEIADALENGGGGGGAAVYNATITIQKNGTKVDDFTANQRTDKTINITVPTQASDINAATATQGGKADTAVQTIKVNSASTGVTKTGDTVDITAIPASIVSAGALVNGMAATTQAISDDSTKLATTAYVHDVVDALPSPMVFKGTLGNTGATISALPIDGSAEVGDTYKVVTDGTYVIEIDGSETYTQDAKRGDIFICRIKETSSNIWTYIPSGDEPSGTVTNVAVANGGGLTVSGSPITSSGTITVGHSNSVTAKTSSSVKKFTYDANGHVTGSSELSTAESNALASGITSADVTQITTNKNNISSIGSQIMSFHYKNDTPVVIQYEGDTRTSLLLGFFQGVGNVYYILEVNYLGNLTVKNGYNGNTIADSGITFDSTTKQMTFTSTAAGWNTCVLIKPNM